MGLRHYERLLNYFFCIFITSYTIKANLRFLTQNTLSKLGLQLVVVLSAINFIVEIETVEADLAVVTHIALELSAVELFFALA